MRKPTAQHVISNVGDDPVEKTLPRTSEPLQSNDSHQQGQAFDGSLQVQVITGVEKHTDEKTADGEHCRLRSEGNGSPSKVNYDDLTAVPVNANCSTNNTERPVSTKGVEMLISTVSESPHKSQSTVGSSVNEKAAVLPSSEGKFGLSRTQLDFLE